MFQHASPTWDHLLRRQPSGRRHNTTGWYRVLLLDSMFIQPWSSTTNINQSSEKVRTVHWSIYRARSTVLKAYSILPFTIRSYTVTFISRLQLGSMVPSTTICLPLMPRLLLPVCSQDSNVVTHTDSINKHWRIDVGPVHPTSSGLNHSFSDNKGISPFIVKEKTQTQHHNTSTTWGTMALWGRKPATFS